MRLQPNPKFGELPKIGVGDFVHLKVDEETLLKCRVLSISGEEISGFIKSVHHPTRELKLRSGNGAEFIGMELKFKKPYVHAVVSSDA